jgi:hypothetical protein
MNTPSLQLVRRKCRVCEWEGVLVETPDTVTACPWCHAPTKRAVIVSHIEGLEDPHGKNPYAAALGRLGGLKGGHARAKRLTSQERSAIARKAARARWGKKR